jgi:WD40 repeat protein
MPPEQAAARNEAIGPLADVYSLGAMLYCLLGGRPPFQAASPLDTLTQVLKKDPVPLRHLDPKVPRDLETICLKCLEKEPRKRYQTANELVEELRRFLDNEPIHARPVSRSERCWRWCRRRPAVATLSVALLLLSVFLTVAGPLVAIRQTSLASSEAEARQRADWQAERAMQNAVEAMQNAEEATQARRQTRRHLYAAQMFLAQQAWEAGDLGRTTHLLELQRPTSGQNDERGFEWYRLWRLCHQDQLTLPATRAKCATFSPDGSLLARAHPGEVSLWDVTNRQVQHTLRTDPIDVQWVQFSPNGRLLAAACNRNSNVKPGDVMVWELATQELLYSLRGHQKPVRRIAFSPDGTMLASASEDNTVKIWDVASGEEKAILSGHRGYFLSVAFSPDGKTIATGGGNDFTVRLWNAETFEPIKSLERTRDKVGSVKCVAFSPDSQLLAVNESLWEVASGRLRYNLSSGSTNAVAFSADGERLAVAGRYSNIRLWDTRTGQRLGTFKGHRGSISSVDFSPDGEVLVSAGGSVKLWDSDPPVEPLVIDTGEKGQRGRIDSVAFSPTDRLLATADGSKVLVWELPDRHRLTLPHDSLSIAFSPDGKLLASGGSDVTDRTVRLWDTTTGNQVVIIEGCTGPIAMAPDGKTLAASDPDGIVVVWTLATRQQLFSIQEAKSRPDPTAPSSSETATCGRRLPVTVPMRLSSPNLT